jgi:hypothetical protein
MRKQNISKDPNDLEKFKSIQKIAEVITNGRLNDADLTCPYCGGQLIFSFTRGRPGRFGLFIQCKDCQRWTHFNLGAMPPNFSDDLVMEHYQKMEDEVVDGANQFMIEWKKKQK